LKQLTLILLSIRLLGMPLSAAAAPVDQATAEIVAVTFIKNILDQTSQASASRITAASCQTISRDGLPCLYLFLCSPAGFIVVSADDHTIPVLAYSPDCMCPPDTQPPAFQTMLSLYAGEIGRIREHNPARDPVLIRSWETLACSSPQPDPRIPLATVGPLLSSAWDQDFPYNSYCPEDNYVMPNYNGHVPAGCVAVAMAQIMYYWRFPETGQGSHCIDPPSLAYGPQCAEFGNTQYPYSGMLGSTEEECDPIALLVYHAGVSVDMDYGNTASYAWTTKIPEALINYFRYSSSAIHLLRENFSTSSWIGRLKSDLDDGKPLIYQGLGNGVSHAFVCDGYQTGNYFHFNFGWGGLYDGYYLLDNLNPGGFTFNLYQQAVLHIEPSVYIYPAYCSGASTVTEYAFGSLEDGSGPEKNYRNNSSCSWLIQPFDGIENVTLNFNRFDLAANDVVTIYDGPGSTSPVIGSFSGSSLPPPVHSTGPALFISFSSDGTFNANGFQADFTSTPITFCESSVFLTDLTGSISDGSEGYMYRNNTGCQWLIIPQDALSTTLTFEEFSTESDWDKLEIVELGTGTQLAVISGDYAIPPDPVVSETGMMMLLFTTNKTNRGSGWYANYSVTVSTENSPVISDLAIYPNPAREFLTINPGAGFQEPADIMIYSTDGRLCWSETAIPASGFPLTIDLLHFGKGILILKIATPAGTCLKKIAHL